MTALAAVVLAHRDPMQVRRLVRSLHDVPIFLHCDAKTSEDQFSAMIARAPDRVHVCRRIPTSLASWSLVEAEVLGLRQAVSRTNASHIAVLSGSDYPLLSVPGLLEELQRWPGQSYFWNVPLPHRPWDTPRHPDGGLWRLRRRFWTRDGQVVFARGVPLRWPVPREVPPGVEPRAGSQWKIYARRHVIALLDIIDSRADLVRYWRSSLVPDETFVASVLGSEALMGRPALAPCWLQPWFTSWPGDAQHPRWLVARDFDRLAAAAQGPSVGPADAISQARHDAGPHRKLFARKFSTSTASHLLDRIDEELRQG